MLAIFDNFRGTDGLSLAAKLLVAAICGAAIGLERTMKDRSAGLRTHILVCLSGAVAAVTGNYIALALGMPADATRISAQVVAGLGFIGAGAIVLSGGAVSGLTTAAGLWATGIIGIAAGSGFYEGALLGAALVLLTQTLLRRLDALARPDGKYTLELCFTGEEALRRALALCTEGKTALRELRVRKREDTGEPYAASLTLQGPGLPPRLEERLRELEGVTSVSEIGK